MAPIKLAMDMSKVADRKMLGKLRRGDMITVKPVHLSGEATVTVDVPDAVAKKIEGARRRGVGTRVKLDESSAKTMMGEGLMFTSTGRVMKGGKVKSLKQLNRETSRAFKKAGKEIESGFKQVGEELKTVPKYYRENIREYTSPIFKQIIESAIPMAGEAVTQGLLEFMDADPAVSKVVSKAVAVGLKKPANMAYKKSGLGLKGDLEGLVKKGKKAVTEAVVGKGLKEDIKKVARQASKKLVGSSVVGALKKAGRKARAKVSPIEKAVDYVGSGLKSDVGRVVRKARAKGRSAVDYVGGELISSPELILGHSKYINDEVDGGVGSLKGRAPVSMRPRRIEMKGRGLYGGMMYTHRFLDPLDKSYEPNAEVDAFHPELNFGKGLYTGRN